MQILPVLDLMHGQVVRGVGGRRHEYRPIISPLINSADPLAVAQAFRDHFGLTLLYLADLDAIAGSPPSIALFGALQDHGFTFLVDAGLRTAQDARPLLDASVAGVVAGLETLTGPDALRDLVQILGPERLVFSLDLKDGQPLAAVAWPDADCNAVARLAIAQGVRRILVLDLARVGQGGGTGTEGFCRELKRAWPDVEVLAGGGVRDRDDLARLRHASVDGVLIASALHDGRLRRADLF
jgi:phosphoribosylformimino-5-aminoimidazole carboxamide ribotide isomerase